MRNTPEQIEALRVFVQSYNRLCKFWGWLVESGRVESAKWAWLIDHGAGSSLKYVKRRRNPPPRVSPVECRYASPAVRGKFLRFSEETMLMIRELQRDWQDATSFAAATRPTVNDAAARPKIAIALRAMYPTLSMVDAARIANSAIDKAIDGDRSEVLRLMSDFSEILEAQEATWKSERL